MEGNLRFKIDWASLIAGRKFTVFALFSFVFEGKFQVQAPRGAYIWRYDITEGRLRYEFGVRIFGGAYTCRDLFSEILRCFSILFVFCFYLTPFLPFSTTVEPGPRLLLFILNRETICIDLYKGNWYKDRMAIQRHLLCSLSQMNTVVHTRDLEP